METAWRRCADHAEARWDGVEINLTAKANGAAPSQHASARIHPCWVNCTLLLRTVIRGPTKYPDAEKRSHTGCCDGHANLHEYPQVPMPVLMAGHRPRTAVDRNEVDGPSYPGSMFGTRERFSKFGFGDEESPAVVAQGCAAGAAGPACAGLSLSGGPPGARRATTGRIRPNKEPLIGTRPGTARSFYSSTTKRPLWVARCSNSCPRRSLVRADAVARSPQHALPVSCTSSVRSSRTS